MYYDFKVKIPEVKGKIYERPLFFLSLWGDSLFCEGDKPKSMVQAPDFTTGKHLHFREKGLILSVMVKRFTQ